MTRLAPDVARWIAGMVLTTLIALGLLVAGIFAGATGLAMVGLIAVVAFGVLALAFWRRAVFALAVIAFAVASGVALGGGSVRVQPSFGTHSISPDRLSDLDGATYRRGVGGLIIDLRAVQFTPGSTTRLTLRADSSRVVVALNRNSCVSLRLRAQPLQLNSALDALAPWTRAAGVELPIREGVSMPWFTPALLDRAHPDDVGRLSSLGVLPAGFSGYIGAPGTSPTQFFGRTLSRAYPDTFDQRRARRAWLAPFVATRTTRDPNAAVLDLRVSAGGPIVVRDFPDGSNVSSLYTGSTEPLYWPFDQTTPPSPEDLNVNDRWPDTWDRSNADLRARWAEWERQTVREARRLARLQAGGCASREGLRNQWQVARYGGVASNDYSPKRLIAVNGLGELIVPPAYGSIASASPAELARRTGTRLLDTSAMRARELAYAHANLVDPR